MKLKTLHLENVRRYPSITLTCHPGLNVITGPNGAGKTTLLESLFILALTKSYKAKDAHVRQNEALYFKISGVFNDATRDHRFELLYNDQGKQVKVNEVSYPRLSDYIGRVALVMFAPEDLELIKGSPKGRRRFLDLELSQRDKAYVQHLNHYNRVLKERNEWLKRGFQQPRKNEILGLLTDQLVHYGEKIKEARQRFIAQLNPLIQTIHQTLAPTDPVCHLDYEAALPDQALTVFEQKHAMEWQQRTTLLGIHRDDLVFKSDQGMLIEYASQGQMRTAVLALKLALAQWFQNYQQQSPIIVFDDVLSELDSDRQTALLEQLNPQAQVLITSTTLDHLALEHVPYHHIHILDGEIQRSEPHDTV
jgi:DNA replication and repair protein RecF